MLKHVGVKMNSRNAMIVQNPLFLAPDAPFWEKLKHMEESAVEELKNDVMDHIAPLEAKIREEQHAQYAKEVARQREEREMKERKQREHIADQRAEQDEKIAEALVTAEELHTHMMNCRIYRRTKL